MKKIRVFQYEYDRNKQLINGLLYWSKCVPDDMWLLRHRDFEDEMADLNRQHEGVFTFRYFVHDVL